MGKKYLFSEDGNGRSREIKVDPKHVERQMAEERAAGRKPVLLDEDERIGYGLLGQQIRKDHGR